MRDKDAGNDLRDMQEAVFAGNVKVEKYTNAIADYVGTRDSKLYLRTKTRRVIIYVACFMYVAIIAYGKFHYLLPWHVG
jgi:hypothetical protein